jgi:hypothetical protein
MTDTDTVDVTADRPRQAGPLGPWSWRPDTAPWAAAMAELAPRWSSTVSFDVPGFDVAVAEAFSSNAAWICHPLSGALTHDETRGRTERDLGFIVRTAAHAGLDGRVDIDARRWCWSPTGGFAVEAGTHDVAQLVQRMTCQQIGLAIDPWCTSLGYAAPDTCLATVADAEQQAEVIEHSVLVALRAQAYAAAAVVEPAAWIHSLVAVVVPLDGASPYGRSASRADLPGLVFLDTKSEVAVLELLVHEAAHHLLYFAEARRPLVDPDDTRRFESPLRPDLRPLRGILLAYHALAYICALYHDLDASAIFGGAFDAADVADLASKRDEAGATLHAAVSSFTDHGRDFLRRTDEVAAHGS